MSHSNIILVGVLIIQYYLCFTQLTIQIQRGSNTEDEIQIAVVVSYFKHNYGPDHLNFTIDVSFRNST